MKTRFFFYPFYGTVYELVFVKEQYANNGTLAIEAYCKSDDFEGSLEPFAAVTVNLPVSLASDTRAYFDSNNNSADLMEILVENGIARDTGFKGQSGYCTYPLYEFDLLKLNTLEDLRKEFELF